MLTISQAKMEILKKKFEILLVFIIVVSISGKSGISFADDATEARFHFQRGVELFKQLKIEEALEQFLISNRLVKNANAVFNAAKCFEKLGRLNDAFALYSEYLQFELKEYEKVDGQAKLKEVEDKVATILVTSKPEKAVVYVDRQDLGSFGMTPRVIAITPGVHTVIVTAPGYFPAQKQIETAIGKRIELYLELEPIVGTVKFQPAYKNASVVIDGKEERNIDMPGELVLPVGTHTLKIKAEGYIPEEKVVNVSEKEPVSLDFVLVPLPPPSGTLNIVSAPSSALVKLDGKEFGFTPLVKSATSGKHSILVESNGMQSWKSHFELKENETLFITVDMVPESIPKKHKMGQKALWVFAGLFAAGGISTGVSTIILHKKFDESPSSKLEYRGEFLNLITDGLFVLSGITLISGTVWHLISKRATKMQSKGEFSYGAKREKLLHE